VFVGENRVKNNRHYKQFRRGCDNECLGVSVGADALLGAVCYTAVPWCGAPHAPACLSAIMTIKNDFKQWLSKKG
jgi:hypothetical protein